MRMTILVMKNPGMTFKSELNDDGDDDDVSELMHLDGDELT